MNLETTNLLLGIMAAVSVLEALALIAAGMMGYRAYKRTMDLIQHIEQHQLAPLAARAQEVLGDVKSVTARVRQETERVDEALRERLDRVDATAVRVRSRVRAGTGQVIGMIWGLRTMIEALLSKEDPPHSRAEAAGRV